MTNQEIIDVVSAHEAGMRIEFRSRSYGLVWVTKLHENWNFIDNEYRIRPKDADKWERIKAPDTNFHCKVERRKVPLEALNWAGGPWCVKSVAGTPQLVTEVHEDWVVAGGGSVYRYANMMGMYRARGWSGDPDLEWLECWKYEDEESEAE